MKARARRAAVLTLAPLFALLATADVSQERSNPAPLVQADALARPVLVSRKQLGDIPYLQMRVPKPVRTIIYVHGGPLIPTLDGPTEFDRYLALRFRARVIKPVYYGSSERPPGGTAPSFNIEHPADLPKEEVEALVLRAVRSEYGGMPRAVEEVRRFIRQLDGPSTIVVGESAGSVIAALSAQAPHRS